MTDDDDERIIKKPFFTSSSDPVFPSPEEHMIRWWHRLYIWALETKTDIDGIQYKHGFGKTWIVGEEKKPR